MLQTLKRDNSTWTLQEGLSRDFLFGLPARARDFGRHPELSLVKDNNVRSAFICRTGLPPPDPPGVFVKRYKRGGFRDAVKHLFVPSKAASEWRSLLAFQDRALPCPRPLAVCEERSGGILGESCLVTELLDPAMPLNEYCRGLPGHMDAKRALIRSLAELIRKLHAGSVFFRDLHAGNIMVKTQAGKPPALYFIDLHRALLLPRLARWMRSRDLAQLSNSLPGTRTDRLRFLEEYARGSRLTKKALRSFQHDVYNRAQRLERRRILSRSKRCLKNSSVFEISASGGERCCDRRDFGRAAAADMIARHLARREGGDAQVVKRSSKSVLTTHDDAGGFPLCVKGYRFIGAAYALKNAFRKTRAMKCWIAANGLLVRGIATPLPLAVVEKRRGLLPAESFIITRWLAGAFELNRYVRERLAEAPASRRQAFMKSLAAALRHMHAQGVYHADLKSNNILVVEGKDGGWEFNFIDLDRVAFRRTLTFYQRAKNLAQINASVSSLMTTRDRLKFFHYYARGTACFDGRKKYYRKIIAIGRTKITGPYGLKFD